MWLVEVEADMPKLSFYAVLVAALVLCASSALAQVGTAQLADYHRQVQAAQSCPAVTAICYQLCQAGGGDMSCVGTCDHRHQACQSNGGKFRWTNGWPETVNLRPN